MSSALCEDDGGKNGSRFCLGLVLPKATGVHMVRRTVLLLLVALTHAFQTLRQDAVEAPSIMLEKGSAPAHVQLETTLQKRCGQPLLDELIRAWDHHWSKIETHSAYFTAVATRAGQHIWSGRTVLAALLVRFRLTAFTSEVGESFRPLVASWQVSATYAVSWAYVSIDIILRTLDEYALRGRTWRVMRTLLFFSIFHTVATMLIPAIIIHEAVHRADQLLHAAARRVAATASAHATQGALSRLWWAPSLVGLSLIPLMPLFDEPIEHLLEDVFARVWKKRHRSCVKSDAVDLSRPGLELTD